MLNDKEKKVLDRYALLPKLIRASIWMVPGVIILTILLEIINENYLYGRDTNSFGIIMTIVVIMFFIVANVSCRIILRRASHDATWQAITQRIEAVYIRPSSDELSLADISKAKRSTYFDSFDEHLHEAFRIFDYYPKSLLKRVLFVGIPCLLIIGSYVPTYINNYLVYAQEREGLSKVMTALIEAFDDCYEIYYDDPYGHYYEYGYYFMAYPDYDMEDYIAINILNDASIDYVSYKLSVDLSIDKETNLEDMQARLDELYAMLVSADIAIDERYLTEPVLSEAFITAFLENEEYEDVTYSQGGMYTDFYILSFDSGDRAVLYISAY